MRVLAAMREADGLDTAVRAVLEQSDHAARARALAAELDALPDVGACVASLPALVCAQDVRRSRP